MAAAANAHSRGTTPDWAATIAAVPATSTRSAVTAGSAVAGTIERSARARARLALYCAVSACRNRCRADTEPVTAVEAMP